MSDIPDDIKEIRPGFRVVRFPVGYGELKGVTVFRGEMILAFENGVFRMPPGRDAEPIQFVEIGDEH